MLDYNPVTGQKGQCVIAGRGAVAIYLALKNISQYGKCVIVPANICYAAVFPIIYAGYTPLFCDVNPSDGNVSLRIIKDAYNDSVAAAIIPHMYGNPVSDMCAIKSFFLQKGVKLIEDCASLMTNRSGSYRPGTVGDYVIYSTGYSKTVDIGIGGLLFSVSADLEDAEKEERSLNPYQECIGDEWRIFSKIYRTIRNNGQNSLIVKGIYKSFEKTLKDLLIYSINDKYKNDILNNISRLDEIIVLRENKYNLYLEHLKDSDCGYSIYKFEDGAVPWRFNMLVREETNRAFIEYCLRYGLPVSDWYPCVTPIFGIYDSFDDAMWHENHIVNFPLLIPDEEIIRICRVIKGYKEKK